MTLRRLLPFPDRSFFLFGPRGVGKSTWLRDTLPKDTLTFNLLDSELFMVFNLSPAELGARLKGMKAGSWICIDEIQKVPALLDEVHRLIEERRLKFALSGSSARKLKRGGANLLAGRAVTRSMGSFSFAELKKRYDLDSAMEFGLLPLVALDYGAASDVLRAYVHTYIREEIKEEGLVRKVDPFLRFLEVAGSINGKQLNGDNIAREARIPRSSVDSYFSILEDTLLGHFLPAYRPQVKVRERTHPKFFWFDPGVARASAGLLSDPVDAFWLGTALETLVFHELRLYNETSAKFRPLAFYRTPAGTEIDFVIETRKRTSSKPPHVICIEVKLATRWKHEWEGPMRLLNTTPGIVVDRMIGLYRGREILHYDGLDVLPVEVFFAKLHAGDIF